MARDKTPYVVCLALLFVVALCLNSALASALARTRTAESHLSRLIAVIDEQEFVDQVTGRDLTTFAVYEEAKRHLGDSIE